MTDRLQFYDVFSAFIPGVLVFGVVLLAFPEMWASFQVPKLPDAFEVIILTVTSLFIGHIIQALSSLIEPFMHWTWGGRPSERALVSGLGNRYFSLDTATRIRKKLLAKVGPKASDRSLFLYAMTIAESAPSSRTAAFNGSYAYHRALFLAAAAFLIILTLSARFGSLRDMPVKHSFLILLAAFALLLLLWHRAKQRAFYYIREVLLTGERILDNPPPGTTATVTT
jgi:hypothetical protein